MAARVTRPHARAATAPSPPPFTPARPPAPACPPAPAANKASGLGAEGILLIIVCIFLTAVVGLVGYMFVRLRKLQVDPSAYESLQGRCELEGGGGGGGQLQNAPRGTHPHWLDVSTVCVLLATHLPLVLRARAPRFPALQSTSWGSSLREEERRSGGVGGFEGWWCLGYREPFRAYTRIRARVAARAQLRAMPHTHAMIRARAVEFANRYSSSD